MNGFERKVFAALGATAVADQLRNLNHARRCRWRAAAFEHLVSGRLDSRAGMNTPSRCLAHSSRARAKGECVCSPFGDSGFLGRPDLH